jgi:hypothetical protein
MKKNTIEIVKQACKNKDMDTLYDLMHYTLCRDGYDKPEKNKYKNYKDLDIQIHDLAYELGFAGDISFVKKCNKFICLCTEYFVGAIGCKNLKLIKFLYKKVKLNKAIQEFVDIFIIFESLFYSSTDDKIYYQIFKFLYGKYKNLSSIDKIFYLACAHSANNEIIEFFIKKCIIDINKGLLYACKFNNHYAIDTIMDLGAKFIINKKCNTKNFCDSKFDDDDKNICLIVSCKHNDLELVKYMIENKKAKGYWEESLYWASKNNAIHIVEYLLTKYDYTTREIDSSESIDVLCMQNNASILKVLFKHIKDKYYRIKDENEDNDIFFDEPDFCLETFEKACRYNAKDIINYLSGENIEDWAWGFVYACAGNQLELCKYILDNHKNDVFKNNSYIIGPALHYSILYRSNKDIINLLFDNGATINLSQIWFNEDVEENIYWTDEFDFIDIINFVDCIYERNVLKRHKEILNNYEMCDIVETVTNKDISNNVLKYLV